MSQNTVLCRICLACNVRLFPIAETPLQIVYQRITNTIINIADSKPVRACYICYAHLNKCYKLMLASIKAEGMLSLILETDPVVSKKSIAMVDCRTDNLCSSLKTRPVEYFDLSTYVDTLMVKDELTVGDNKVKEDPEYVNVKEIVEMESKVLGVSENAVVCRICLAVDVRMFTIANTPLQHMYERITGNLLHTADSRPHTACYLCHAQLIKCHRLMLQATNADKWMTAMLKEYSELSPKVVAVIDRKDPGLRSSLKTTPVECYDSLTLDDPTVFRHGLEITVKIEVEPDVYVGSPPPEMLSDTENSKIQCDTEGDTSKSKTQLKKRTRAQWVVGRDIDEADTPEGAVSPNQQKPVKRKRTKRPDNSNDKPETQEKKEKPRRVYKKRIRAYIHECPICKRLFNRTNHLKDHMKTHTDDRPFECSVCQRRFIQKINLKNHMMTHTGEKPFECDICNTGFIAKSDFKRHLNTHKEERLFECSICRRRFTQMPYLKAHISTHTSEKPHECHICHRRFSQKPYLKNHLKRHVDSERAELRR